jgi:hypothetical protein
VIRISRRASIPEHAESLPLRGLVRALGWALAGLGIVGGFLAAGAGEGRIAAWLAPLLVVVGGVVLAALWQCGKYDLTVGTTRIEVGTGPFKDTLATGAVESSEARPATAWRKLFAEREVVLVLSVGRWRRYPVPTRDPEGLRAALPPPGEA